MTKISREDVLKLARLSSIQLDETEVDGLAADLERILGYVEQLNELDTDGVEPAYQVTGLTNVSRDDMVEEPTVSREALLALAPEQQDDHIKVHKVL